jgi:hypothetical protein
MITIAAFIGGAKLALETLYTERRIQGIVKKLGLLSG